MEIGICHGRMRWENCRVVVWRIVIICSATSASYTTFCVWMCMDMNIFHTSGLFLAFKEWRLYHSHLFCLLLLCTKTVCSLSLPFFCLRELLWASLGLSIFLLTCVCVCIVWNTCLPAVFPPSLHIKSRRTYAQSVWFQLSPSWHFTKKKKKD